MNQSRLRSSSLTITRNNHTHLSRLILVASRILTFKNFFIVCLFCFVLISTLIRLETNNTTASSRGGAAYVYLIRLNATARAAFVRSTVRNTSESSGEYNSHNHTRTNETTASLRRVQSLVVTTRRLDGDNEAQVFETEARAIKESIKQAFLSVKKQIDFCPLYLDKNLNGPLNVNDILEQIGLNGLVQFHDKSKQQFLSYKKFEKRKFPSNEEYGTKKRKMMENVDRSLFFKQYIATGKNKAFRRDLFNLTTNTYNSNPLMYLDKDAYESNKNNAKFLEFWSLWHTSDLSVINGTIVGSDDVELGGSWRPSDCISRYRVAIIIPYRDRLPHLHVLVRYLHVFLRRQMIAYRIFVVEPTTPLNVKFNKGRVMNSAYLEALKVDSSFNCVIFHDVDLIPEDDRNMYTCSPRPKHLSVCIDKFDYRLPYDYLVGGVFSIKIQDYREINGYSNSYWGWGGEDDDFAARIKHSKMVIDRPPTAVARYKMMRHKLQTLNEDRHKLLKKTVLKHKKDGLNSVEYKVVEMKLFTGFTYFHVDVGSP